ncbi:hypothetical protein RE628_21540 [Paenibacillus sp. D2_2]|uniref:hypothetical protein n=1 Tax=Paenibacillus sp. D2_2 TaxID=3073092 RepID=UPI002816962F|nr:hypothetical protein [Paenibacillus sp. D2_2]WMT39910.1 hypothetical protein RE628_21540 [Paenibacillus sp. D2_2]
MIIQVKELSKNYTTYQRGASFRETVASMFRRKTLVVEAVKGITFSVEKGRLLVSSVRMERVNLRRSRC